MQQTSISNPSRAFDAAMFSRAATFRKPDTRNLDSVEASELGFDFARRGMPPPEAPGAAFMEGWREGQARFGRRNDPGTLWDRKLLRLRLSAWRRNRIVDESVTAAHLEHISVSVCPITREALTSGTGDLSDATVDRVFNGGAYAVGNLAVMSQRANLAKANRTIEEIMDITRRLGAEERHDGLGRVEWARLASLCCIALPREMGHHYMPLLVWPPNGLAVSNVMGMVMMSTSLLAMRFFRPAVAAEARKLLGTKGAKKAFDEYILALRARRAVLWKGARSSLPCVFHALEDAWLAELVWKRFLKFFTVTPPPSIIAMTRALDHARGGREQTFTDDQLSRWAIESRGYLTERRDDIWGSVPSRGRLSMA